MNRRIVLIGAALALVPAIACSSGGDESATTSPPPVPTAAPPSSDEAPGDRFLALVEPLNCVLGEARQVAEAGWKEQTAVAGRIAEAQRDFAGGLTAYQWPAEAQPSVDVLFDAVSREAEQWAALAGAESESEAQSLGKQIDTFIAAGASASVRTELGLEQTDVFCPGPGG